MGLLAIAAGLSLTAAACGTSRPHRSVQPAVTTATTSTTTTLPVRLLATNEPWHLPAAVSRPVVLPDGAGFVILGGLATGDTSTSRVVHVDPASGSADVAGTLAVAVHDSAGAAFGARDYIFGGGSYVTVSTVQAWTAGPAVEVGRLPAPRSDLSSVTADGVAYIVGGFDGSRMDDQILSTSDGLTFQAVASLPIPVRYAAVGYTHGALWVFGGVTSTSEGGTSETSAIQRVDLATGDAAVVGHLPEPMGHATAITLAGQVFVLGGRSGSTPSGNILSFDSGTATVQPAGTLPQAISDAGSVVLGNTAYLVGGEVTGPTEPLNTVVLLRQEPAAP